MTGNRHWGFLVLVSLLGISTGFEIVRRYELDVNLLWPLLIGPFVGWVQIFVYAVFLNWCGAWLGGRASRYELQILMAWGLVPVLLMAAISIPFDIAGFPLRDRPVWNVIEFILAACSLTILLRGSAEVQGFGVGRSILNHLLAWLLYVPPLIVALAVVFCVMLF